ncbi:MAG: hypothetical protein R3312_03720 [Gammaproteobacteria bacterium]|nr:hypothetical protein [Gammaproteobacteria bacterium]
MIKKSLVARLVSIVLLLMFSDLVLGEGNSQSQAIETAQWVPVTGADRLKAFMGGLSTERILPNGWSMTGEYFSDGSGLVHQFGAVFPRSWDVFGEDQICIHTIYETDCFILEQSTLDPTYFRVFDAPDNEWIEFQVINQKAVITGRPPRRQNQGSAASASAAEIAAELTDPNTTLGLLATLYDYQVFDGDLADAGNQTAQAITFQPSIPYPLKPGRNLFFRPAIPLILDQPVWDNTTGTFQSEGGSLGDIGYDATMGFSFNVDGGRNSILIGVAGSIPTATNDVLASDQWTLGPEIGFTAVRKWGSIGGILYRQWDIAGDDSYDTDVTGGQYVYNINLGQGWQITGSPTFSYDHKASSGNAFTFPLAIGVAKTSIVYGRPIMFSAEYWHYIESPNMFGPSDQVRLSITPIVPLPW